MTDQIIVRPLDAKTEAPYLHSTARRMTAEIYGGGYAHWPTILELVDRALDGAEVNVALLSDEPDILGYVAYGRDQTIEFVYLRRALEDAPLALVISVVRALLQDRAVILRRPTLNRHMRSIVLAGYVPSVIPRAL